LDAGIGPRNQIDLLLQLNIITNAQQAEAAKAGMLKLWLDQTPLPLDRGAYYE